MLLVVKNIGIEGPGLWEGVVVEKGVEYRVSGCQHKLGVFFSVSPTSQELSMTRGPLFGGLGEGENLV